MKIRRSYTQHKISLLLVIIIDILGILLRNALDGGDLVYSGGPYRLYRAEMCKQILRLGLSDTLDLFKA